MKNFETQHVDPGALPHWSAEGFLFDRLTACARGRTHFPGKVRLIHMFERFINNKIIRHAGGGRMRINAGEYIGWSLLAHGSFEPDSIALAIRLMKPGGVFLDIGANRGLYSIAVGTATPCRVVSIEPDPYNFHHLLQNISLNSGLNISPLSCGAASGNHLMQLDQPTNNRSAWTRVHSGSFEPSLPYVVGLKLDLILNELKIPDIQLMKMDVEGYELNVLKGLDWNSPLRPRYILMECNAQEKEKQAFLLERDYSISTIHGLPPSGETGYPEGNLLFTDNRNP